MFVSWKNQTVRDVVLKRGHDRKMVVTWDLIDELCSVSRRIFDREWRSTANNKRGRLSATSQTQILSRLEKNRNILECEDITYIVKESKRQNRRDVCKNSHSVCLKMSSLWSKCVHILSHLLAWSSGTSKCRLIHSLCGPKSGRDCFDKHAPNQRTTQVVDPMQPRGRSFIV